MLKGLGILWKNVLMERLVCIFRMMIHGVSTDHLCQHSGICINAGNSHHCQCPLGYTGSYCEEQLDECSSNPCQHGATCRDFIGGYRCECVPGYQGVNCEYEVDECQNQPCQNGGTCVDLVNHFKCSCPPGTRGMQSALPVSI
eukprot:XP_013976080.1 neurogenic locus notch homolog protein 2-like [Canis lupus familiaris]